MRSIQFRVLVSVYLAIVLLTSSCVLRICDEENQRVCEHEGADYFLTCVGSEWFEQTCDSGRYCHEGACTACEEGARECLAYKGVYRSCVDGSWVDASCAEGEICEAGACVLDLQPCEKSERTCANMSTVRHCVLGELPRDEACEYEHMCDKGSCLKSESCTNSRLDEGELAVDCGGICRPCVSCARDGDCLETGFCDSAFGYVCSKACVDDADCERSDAWDGFYCRGDGRCASKVFASIWEVTEDSLGVYLPFDTGFPKAACDFNILWGDEDASIKIGDTPRVTNCLVPENRHHVYKSPGRYEIKIVGRYDGWGRYYRVVNNDTESAKYAPKLIEVRSFGPVGLGIDAFKDCSQLVAMPSQEVPDATKLHSLEGAFYRASAFNAPIGHWDTRHVKSLKRAFSDAVRFNQPIGKWDSSQVRDMDFAFSGAKAFNQALGAWDTSNVVTMFEMFRGATAFDQGIGSWKTGKVLNMGGMFYGAAQFNGAIGSWDTSAVLNMSFMFSGAKRFDQSLAWDTSKVTDMAAMFKDAEAFDQDISAWDTAMVANMSFMFSGAKRFNQPLPWSTVNVTTMSSMFSNARAFNQSLSAWDVGEVTDMKKMFLDAVAFDQVLTSWSLMETVELLDVFKGSGMSRDNVCPLLGSSSAWKSQIDKLGVIFDCP